MSKLLNQRTAKLAVALLAVGLVVCGAFPAAPIPAQQKSDLPEGKGVEPVRAKCLTCHEADLITQQRLSRPGWMREVDKMIRWGAAVSDAEKESMIDYLAANFGPQLSVNPQAAATTDRGSEIFKSKCLVCHEADLTEQQRLTRAGWIRELEKMIRWGAAVSDGEKEPLVDYLFKSYGPRSKTAGK